MWTLTYAGTEKSFADWGFTDPKMQQMSQGAGTFTVRMPGAVNLINAPPIPFRGAVVIWRGRTFSGGVYSGGTIVFQGRQSTDRKLADPLNPSETLIFADAWWDLENTVFQHTWAVPGSAPQFYARLNLFQNFTTGLLQSNGAQITEIVNYAATSCGVAIQVGTIDPIFQLPIYPVKAIMCAQAILISLKPCPDAVTSIDYTTTPPTLHVRQRATLPGLTLPYADGVRHESSEITPRPDLQVPCVSLQYQKVNVVNGATQTVFDVKTYPVGISPQQPFALVCPIDLRGAQMQSVTVEVEANAFDPTTTAWWKLKKPDLAGTNYVGLTLVPGSITVKDDTGATISLATYPNELTRGDVLSWMQNGSTPISASHVTVSGKFTYSEVNPAKTGQGNIHVVTSDNPQIISARTKVTNSPAGVVVYGSIQSESTGEWEPVGLEQQIYDSLSQLQYEGEHVILDGAEASETMSIATCANVLNLSGGAVAWATMQATIQRVTIDFFRGRTTITIGPARHLAAGDLEEMLQIWRFRAVWDNPAMRTTGQGASAGGSTVGGDTMAENTSHGNPPPSLATISADLGGGNSMFIQHDATNQQLYMRQVDSTGAPIAGQGSVKLKLADAVGSDLKIQPAPAIVAGVSKTVYLVCSDAVDSLGGGGGTVWL